MSTMPEAPRFEGLDHVSAAPPAPGVLDRIVARTRQGGDGLATMIEAIVTSELFLER